MFSFSLDRIKEIPDELKVIDTVIPPQFSDLREYDHSGNKFLIAESNGIPEYVLVKDENILKKNDQTFFFFDVEELSIAEPQNLQKEKIENTSGSEKENLHKSSSNFNYDIVSIFERTIQNVYNYLKNLNIKQALRISSSDEGFDKLALEEMSNRQIKFMSNNSLGKLVAVVNKYNKLMIIDLENKCKKIFF
jgi:predicted nucleic acid-binding protein